MLGHLTEKADVFGFGVVALEILCGRPNSDSSLEPERVYLLEWAWNLHENNHGLELVDPILNRFNEEEAIGLLRVALLCTQDAPTMRPPMSRVVAMLTGDIEVSTVASRPGYLTDWQFNDMSIFNGTPESSTSEAPLLRFDSLSSASKVSVADYSLTMVTQIERSKCTTVNRVASTYPHGDHISICQSICKLMRRHLVVFRI